MTLRMTSDVGRTGLSRGDIEYARTYGVEARRHHYDREWTDVRHALSEGWSRMRSSTVPWDAVEPDVQAGWRAGGGAVRESR